MAKPLFIAKQSRHASGWLGRIVAFVMARETHAVNSRAIAALNVHPDDHVLDIGCGHGRAVQSLAELATFVAGVDPSELMAQIAVRRNAAKVKRGEVGIAVASAEALPYPTASFDKVLCVHVICFWEDMAAALREIGRVTRPGGTLVLVFRDAGDRKATKQFPAEVYNFPDATAVIENLAAAGFSISLTENNTAPMASSPQPRFIVATRCRA